MFPARSLFPLPPGWMRPDLGAGACAVLSARSGGVSLPPWDSCNLGDHVGDDPQAVAINRQRFAQSLPAGVTPVWLQQVHGSRVLQLTSSDGGKLPQSADGACTTEPGVACVVMVADCLPILLASPQGEGVAALHAGWRGLAGANQQGGIVHSGVRALCEAAAVEPQALRAWLGPCIGPRHFEVGPDVLLAFGVDPVPGQGSPWFQARKGAAHGQPRWVCDLVGLARLALAREGLPAQAIAGADLCTVTHPDRFFSFRRDGRTGRFAAAICRA